MKANQGKHFELSEADAQKAKFYGGTGLVSIFRSEKAKEQEKAAYM